MHGTMVDNPTQQPISLDSSTPAPAISLDSGTNQSYLLSPDLISQRADKYAYALSGTPAATNKDALSQAITQNQEASVRQDAASTINSDQDNKRQSLIAQTLANKQGPLTSDDMTAIDTVSGYNFPYKYPVDPNSVMEINYGKQYASELDAYANKVGDTNFWNYGQLVARNDIEAAKIFGDVATAKHQYLLTKLQDVNTKIQGQTNVGYGLDLAKMAAPVPFNVYYEAKMRGNVPGVGMLEGGDVGTNLARQSDKLDGMPFDQFTQTVDTIYNKMSQDNPQAASVWLSAMMGQSRTDRALNAVNTIGQLADLPIAFKVGQTIYSKLTLQSQVQAALKTSLKAAASPTSTPADIYASVGDLQTSAITNASNILTGRVTGSMSSTQQAFETLPIHLNIMKDDIKASDLAIPYKNNLLEQTDTLYSNLLDKLTNTLRPSELNLDGVAPELLDKISKTVSDRYPGENNSIIKTSIPTLNPVTRLYEVTMQWGKDGGLFFDNLHEAADSAINKGFRVTYTPEQLAELDARIEGIRAEVGAPTPDFKAQEARTNTAAKTVTNLEGKYTEAVAQYGVNHPTTLEHQAELESARGGLRSESTKLSAMRKALGEDTENLQTTDVHGLNYHDTLLETLKFLEAKRAAVSKPGGLAVKQFGEGFYIEKIDNLDYSQKIIRDLIANPDNPMHTSPRSWTSFIPYFNHFRTSEDTFSAVGRGARKAAVFPQSVFLSSVKEEGQIISDFLRGKTRYDPVTGEVNPFWKKGVPGVHSLINRGRLKQFHDVLKYSQDEAHDPITGKTGYYMTPDELNHHYLTRFDRPPSFDETSAYEAIKRWDEAQRIFTQVMVYRGQAIRGNETHQLVFKNADGSVGRSPAFVGARQVKAPSGRGTILIMGDDLKSSHVEDFDSEAKLPSVKKAKLRQVSTTPVATKQDWKDLVKAGTHRLIRIDDPLLQPFKDIGIKDSDTLIHYVLSPNVDSSPLKWDSLPRTGGGRHVYDYSLYIKQPKMKFEKNASYYMGDQTIAAVHHEPLGQDVTRRMNMVRRLIDAGDAEGAKAAYIHNGLEGALEPWKDFRRKFETWKDPETGELHTAIYNSKEDFQVVPRNRSIIDLDKRLQTKYGPDSPNEALKNTWRDATRENSPARNYRIQFTGERDAEEFQAIENKGTVQNPIYVKSPAQKVDPMAMLNRGMTSTVHSLFMDSYKNYAVNSWLREAVNHLKDRESSVWSSPFGTFNTITRNSFLPGTKQEVVNQLMANHFKINQLVGTPSVLDSAVHNVAQKLADAAYSTLGPTKANFIVPQWLMPKLRDPFAFIRSVTFHAYLGLGSPAQLLVQSMTYANMFAISPKYATQGTLGAFLHYLSRINKNPEILNHLDGIATKFGYKPGEFLEAMDALERTGFKSVGAEHSYRNTMSRNNVIQRGTDRFLEWGMKPFQWGEANSRIGAWYTSFKEFRDLHPTGKLSDSDIAQILDKADMYQGNMSSASHSMMNSGVFSLPSQFYMYTARLAELFWSGSRLGGTGTQRNLARARLFAVNLAMFGLPMAAGVTGLPVTDYLRDQLLQGTDAESWYNPMKWARTATGTSDPYVVGKNFVESLINEGVLATGLHMASGKWYNVGPRMGLQGMTNLRDTMNSDSSFWQVLGGASSSLALNTINNGIYPMLHQIFTGDFKNVKLEDFVDIFKESSAVNAAWSTVIAFNTGKWINKNSDYISDTSKANASFMFLTGLKETGQTDIYNLRSIMKDRTEFQKYALKEFGIQMNRAMLADSVNDTTNAQAFFNKAIAWLPASDFPPEKLGAALKRAFQGAGNLVDRTRFQYYFGDKNIPQASKDTLRKAYQSIQQNKGQ